MIVYCVISIFMVAGCGVSANQIPIIVSGDAGETQRLAAVELRHYLSKIYPSEKFVISKDSPNTTSRSIRIGTVKSQPELKKYLTDKPLSGAESYVVTSKVSDEKQTGIILGADDAGVMYGVYGLLEKLGCGFYLTKDILSEPVNEKFDFSTWDLADHPLVKTRLVFNWHNFLSGCTGWNYEHWQQWVSNSQKMGFNTVMVHAYGNNPMFSFDFNGITKPIGYYGTSRKGRDWGRQHVNDVRRLPGGEIFDSPEFGSDAALVPDEKRVEAAQKLMKRVFSHAEKRGVRVCFALDIDVVSALPQEMILALDENARFHNGGKDRSAYIGLQGGGAWLPRPDTEEGYAFYKAQVDSLLKLYPQIDTLALWRRTGGQEWGALKKTSQLPKEWQAEYQMYTSKNPEAAKLPQAVSSFAMNKVVGAFRRALDEADRKDIQISMGSWRHTWVPAAAEFLPREVTLMPLDYETMRYGKGSFLDNAKSNADIKNASGRIIPIIWAHHDDGEYIGRPIGPHDNFHDKLSKLRSRGYGIIHWMTRPLDLYFKSHENQVWASTKNEPYTETCQKAGMHLFGAANGEKLGGYLQDWWDNAPSFGRVTRNHFFFREQGIEEPVEEIRQCRARIETLAGVDLSKMSTEQKERLTYFHELEKLIISFSENQELAYRPASKAIKAGDFDKARLLLKQCDPARTIRQFSRLSQTDGGNRGEESLVLSLGTRWMPDYLAACQAVGLEAVRINYGPTAFEPLAQGAGIYSFHVDSEGKYWSVRGEKETKVPETTHSEDVSIHLPDGVSESIKEIAQTGIIVESPVTLDISPIVDLHKKLAPGKYNLTIYASAASGKELCKVRLQTEQNSTVDKIQGRSYTLKNTKRSEVTVHVIEKEIRLEKSVTPKLQIVPQEGALVLHGLKLEVTNE